MPGGFSPAGHRYVLDEDKSGTVTFSRDIVLRDLTTNGRLRAAINLGNPVLTQAADNPDGVRGVTVDLIRELASRLQVPLEILRFSSAGLVFDALETERLNVVFLAREPLREKKIDFTPPYVLIEGNFVARDSSPIHALADIDREGNMIAVVKGSAYDLYLTRTLDKANIRRFASHQEAVEAFSDENLSAIAGIRGPMASLASNTAGLRLIDEPFMAIRQAVGIPKGREAGFRFACDFIEEMKRSGFVLDALWRSGQSEFEIAPLAGDDARSD